MTNNAMAFGADAFVEGFLRPRLERATSSWFTEPAAERRADARLYLPIGMTLDFADIDLDWLLLLEAIDWLSLGVDQGLLPTEVVTAPQLDPDTWAQVLAFRSELHPMIGAELRGGVELDAGLYWSSLVTSDRSLTAAHRTFLTLMHCASDRLWEQSFSQLVRFVERLSRSGIESLDPRAVDEISWALSGSELDDHRADPASWRAAWLRPQSMDNSAYEYGRFISANRERAAIRHGQLTDARSAMVDAVEFYFSVSSLRHNERPRRDVDRWRE